MSDTKIIYEGLIAAMDEYRKANKELWRWQKAYRTRSEQCKKLEEENEKLKKLLSKKPEEENKHLKELLEECEDYIAHASGDYCWARYLMNEIDEVLNNEI